MENQNIIITKDGKEHKIYEIETVLNIHGKPNIITDKGLILFCDEEGYVVVGEVVKDA